MPTVIARLNVPYGDTYGWTLFHLMMMEHGIAGPRARRPADDLHADPRRRHRGVSIPYLLSLASTPATIVNWGGDEVVSIEEWCDATRRLTGLTPTFEPTEQTIPPIIPDVSKLHATGFVRACRGAKASAA